MRTVWFEKHRPTQIDEVVGQDHLIPELKSICESGEMQHYLFYSPEAGTGKTTVARIIANAKGYTLHTFNASSKRTRGIQFIEEDIIPLSRSGVGETIILLDEADRLTIQAQDALKGVIENATCYFILTCNDISKVSRWLQSRTRLMHFNAIPNEPMLSRLQKICKTEGIFIEADSLNAIVRGHGGDLRNAINALQAWFVLPDENARENFILRLGETFNVKSFLQMTLKAKSIKEAVILTKGNSTRNIIREVFNFIVQSDASVDKIHNIIEICLTSERDLNNGIDEEMVRWDFCRMLSV